MPWPKRERNSASPSREAAASRPTEYERLHRFFLVHRGRFALGLVRVNHPQQRDGVIASLRDELAREGITLVRRNFSQRQVRSLKAELQRDEELQGLMARDPQGVALAIVGLEPSVEMGPPPGSRAPYFLGALNLERDAIALHFSLPITLWLTDFAMDRLAHDAPDFFDFRSGLFVLRFAPSQDFQPQPELSSRPGEGAEPEFSPEVLRERLDILEDRIAELQRKEPLEPADKERLAELLADVGEIYLGAEDARLKTQGIPYLGEARRLYAELGQREAEADMLARMGKAYYWTDQHPLAKARYEQALPIYREIGDRLGEGVTLALMGELEATQGSDEEALELYDQALAILGEIGNRYSRARALKGKGTILQRLGRPAEATFAYQEALTLFEAIGLRGEAEQCRQALETLKEAVEAVQGG